MSQRLPLVLMLAGVFVAASDLTVVSTILPQIIFDLEIPLRTGLSQAAWIVNAYLIAYTITMPFMGRVSDLFGRRNIFLACLLLFSAGSLVAGQAGTLEWMIIGRAVQALGAGAMVPVTMAFVADALPADRRPFALGLVGAVDTAGWVVGPLYGALMILFFQWRWIFFINLPFSLLIGVGLWWLMRDPNPHPRIPAPAERGARSARQGHTPSPVTFRFAPRNADRKRGADPPLTFVLFRTGEGLGVGASLDLLGALALAVALIALTLAFSGTQQESGGSAFAGQTGFNPLAVPLMAVAAVSFVLFVWQERRAAQPLIPLSIFADRTLSAACIANFLVGASLIIAMVNVPIFVNIAMAPTQADAPLLSGEALALLTLGMVAGALVGGWLTGQFGYRVPAWLGLLIAMLGFILMSQWQIGLALAAIAPGLALCGAGFGLVISPVASAVINSVGDEQRGIASAIVLIQRLVGMALGLAALTTWGIYRLNALTAALPPANPTNPAEAARILFRQAQLVSTQVIGEIFAAAALVCLLACLPVIFMRAKLTRTSSGSWFGWR